jgi:ATP-dependent Clp protease ATP-binding subunit ClpA
MVVHNFTGNTGGNNTNGNPPSGNIPNGNLNFGNRYQPNPNPGQDVPDCLLNMNDRFKHKSNCKFREDVIDQTLSVLIGQEKPNPLLIGEAGVGKTKIAEEIAHRLANNHVTIPDIIKGSVIFGFQPSNLVAGSGIRGQLEEKVKELLEFASDKKNKVILFIDEIHMLFSGDPSYEQISQILKPALSRGDIKVIGATTMSEAQKLYKDPAFERRMQSVIVNELTEEQSLEILETIAPNSAQYYGTNPLTTELLRFMVDMSQKYSNGKSHQPDASVTLLDRVCARLNVKRGRDIENAKDPNTGNPQLLQILQTTPIVVNETNIEEIAVSLLRGHASNPTVDYDQATTEIKETVLGQDEQIDFVMSKAKRRSLGLFETTKPLAFLWAGNSGTGKTELAKQIAKRIVDTELIIINMNEFSESHHTARLIGAPAGYVGYDSMQELPLDPLKTNPYRVILLDEFEKAHRDIRRLFMTALDEGYMKTARGERIRFDKAIIIATTNEGFSNKKEPVVGFGQQTTTENNLNATLDRFEDTFEPEILNRFQNNIVAFNDISREVYGTILQNVYKKRLEYIALKKPKYRKRFADELDETTLQELINNSYVKEFNAHPAGATIDNYIESQII